jgi:hypothetical protein
MAKKGQCSIVCIDVTRILEKTFLIEVAHRQWMVPDQFSTLQRPKLVKQLPKTQKCGLLTEDGKKRPMCKF